MKQGAIQGLPKAMLSSHVLAFSHVNQEMATVRTYSNSHISSGIGLHAQLSGFPWYVQTQGWVVCLLGKPDRDREREREREYYV